MGFKNYLCSHPAIAVAELAPALLPNVSVLDAIPLSRRVFLPHQQSGGLPQHATDVEGCMGAINDYSMSSLKVPVFLGEYP